MDAQADSRLVCTFCRGCRRLPVLAVWRTSLGVAMSAVWSDGSTKSQNNAFVGCTGAAPVQWYVAPSAVKQYERERKDRQRVKLAASGQRMALNCAGRATVPLGQPKPGLTIATAADKKYKCKKEAAI